MYWLPLCIITLVTVSCECASSGIHQVTFWDGSLYTKDDYSSDYARYDLSQDEWHEYIQDVPEDVVVQLQQNRTLPITHCLTENKDVCYQITGVSQERDGIEYFYPGTEHVRVSEDGGQSWQIAWEIPAGRRYFMSRFPKGCGGIAMGPYDLAINEMPEGHYVAVALGNQGILIRHPDGTWERYGVLNAVPTPFTRISIRDLSEVTLGLGRELAVLLLATFFFSLTLFVIVWKQLRLLIGPFVMGFLAEAIGYCFWEPLRQLVGDSFWLAPLFLLGTIFFPVTLLFAYRTWVEESRTFARRELCKKAGKVWFGMSIGLFWIGLLPFILWVLGLIPYYAIAVCLSVVFVLLGMWKGGKRIFTLMAQAREKS